jgi:hypothetical protein
LKYFKLGNDKIIEQSDSPESEKDIVNANIKTIIRNYTLYLDDLNNEKYFGTYAPLLADGITVHFFKLIETYPNGDYTDMLTKAKFSLGKVQTKEIKLSLTSLIQKLESMQKQ